MLDPFTPSRLLDGIRLVIEHPKWMLITPDAQALHCVFRTSPSRRIALADIVQATVLENAAQADFPAAGS